MSKAFTSESDDEEDFIQAPALPPGTRNYMTPDGAQKLSDEMERLNMERATLAAQDLDENRRRKAMDRRLEFLTSRLNAAQIIDPAEQPADQVRFGAYVTVRSNDASLEETWRIVGVDEMDLEKNFISWMSPLATVLFEKKIGDRVNFQTNTLTITAIRYF